VDPAFPGRPGWHHADAGQPPGVRGHAARQPRRDRIGGLTGGESTFVGGDSIGLSKDSQNPDAAWNFITWMLGDYNQVEVVAKGGNVVARTDLADNQYSSADERLVLFNEIAGVGVSPFALHFNAAFNDPQSPWIQLFRAAVFDDADDAEIDTLNDGITSVLQGN
jgi:multiple sugar transport system substrate-binding protein